MEDSRTSRRSAVKEEAHLDLDRADHDGYKSAVTTSTDSFEEISPPSGAKEESPYKRQKRSDDHLKPLRTPPPQRPHSPSEALSSAVSTTNLHPRARQLKNVQGRAATPFVTRFVSQEDTSDICRSPSVSLTEHEESEVANWETDSTERKRSLTPIDDTMSIIDWRVKGRFLEYRMTFKDNAENTPPRWVQGQNMSSKVWRPRIEYFFRSNRKEYRKLRAVVGQDHGPGKIDSNWSPKVYKVVTPDYRTLTFLVNDDEKGKPYVKIEGPGIDKARWEYAITLYWRERLYKIQQDQVTYLMNKYSMRPDGEPRSRSIGDCSKQIEPEDDGVQETADWMALNDKIEGIERDL